MFKEIKATFDVVGLTHNGNEYHYHFVIERKESGAFRYGDHSCHTLVIYDLNGKYLNDYLFDTRYDHISTHKPNWIKVWKDYINENWLHVRSIEVIEYEEKEVEERKDK